MLWGLIFLLGGLGALVRFMASRWNTSDFSYGTLLVNIVGSFAIGLMFSYVRQQQLLSPTVGLAISIGFLGALTTFSSFSIDTVDLLDKGLHFKALVNVGLNNILSIGFCWVGLKLFN